MGMFDTVIIDMDLLPISDDEKLLLKDLEFQSKDFECVMTTITITKDSVKIERCDWEEVPKSERPYPDAPDDDLRAYMGALKPVNIKHEDITDLHGYVNIYCYDRNKNIMYDFKLKFTDGKLVNIERI